MLKGYRTLLVGLAMAVIPPALTYLAGVDWNATIGASGAFVISAVIQVAMRLVTTTPVGQK